MTKKFNVGDVVRTGKWLAKIATATQGNDGKWQYEIRGIGRDLLLKRIVEQSELRLA